MKAIFRAAALMLVAIAVLSCEKPAQTGADQVVVAPGQTEAQPPEQAPSFKADAYILFQGLGLWTKDGDKVKYAKAATVGDAVVVKGEPEKLSSEGVIKEYTSVLMQDQKLYYVRSPYVIKAQGLAAVAAEKCVLYSEARIVGATKTIVPRFTIVALLEAGSTSDGFVKISYVGADSAVVSEKWVKQADLASGPMDVQAAIAINVVSKLAEKDKDLKVNILTGAASSYGGSVFDMDIASMLSVLTGKPAQPTVVEAARHLVNEDEVRVYALPAIDEKSVVGKLSYGTKIDSVERTQAMEIVDSGEAYWFRIETPLAGWVFGAYLSDLGATE